MRGICGKVKCMKLNEPSVYQKSGILLNIVEIRKYVFNSCQIALRNVGKISYLKLTKYLCLWSKNILKISFSVFYS